MGAAGIDDLAQIVRRNIGGHAHGDTAGAIDQKIGVYAPAAPDGSSDEFVVVRAEIDGVLVDNPRSGNGLDRAMRASV
jgi:hypothetical protein